VRRKLYRDNSKAIGFEGVPGKVSIGVGRNLDDVGLSEDEIELLLQNDIARAKQNLLKNFPWAAELAEPRLAVLVNMAFNMGIEKLSGFVRMLELVRTGDYENAKIAMLNSVWAKQVGNRATRLAEQMRTGEWQ